MSVRIAALVAVALAFAPAAGGQTPPQVTSTLPAWRAPGAELTVTGTAAAGATVDLLVRDATRATATAGPDGAFSFAFAAPAPAGTYSVAVVADGLRAEAGVLTVRPLRLYAVGDVNLGDGIATAISLHGPRWPWLSVASVLRSADIAVANLETSVSRRGSPWPGKTFTFRGTPASLRPVSRFAGVDVVSLANNHTLDYGRAAFHDTLAFARRFGLRTIGGGASLARAREPAILTRGGLRVALLGFSDVRPPGFDARPGVSGATPAFPEYIDADVRAARLRADVVVVYFHWGIERTFAPNARQRQLARIAHRAGAAVVLGAHPHVLQPVERHGRQLTAWSLGNFVFAVTTPGTERTGILRVGLGTRGVVGSSFRPARINWVQPRLE